MIRKTDIIDHNGINNRTKQTHKNHFNQYTFSDLRKPTIYNPLQEFAYWQGVRHQHNLCEYNKSTQNQYGYRVERQDELENRVMTPGYANFYHEITPERLAHDPENRIYNYYNGWEKNLSDGNVAINSLRAQYRKEQKGNYFRVRDQVHRFLYSTHQGINGPIYHPELM